MAEMHRFSSRRQRLDQSFLANRLKDAKSYKRIAGYFRSSIFELVGEEIADIPHVQIVCNSELDAADVVVSKHIRETALKERWNEAPAEVEALLLKDCYRSIHLRKRDQDIFELRYKETIEPDKNRWELGSHVLARKDMVEKLSESCSIENPIPGR